MNRETTVPAEAVEAAAKALWGADHSHDSILAGRSWETAANVKALDYGQEVERERARMQYALHAALPALRSEWEAELLSAVLENTAAPSPFAHQMDNAYEAGRSDMLAAFRSALSTTGGTGA